MSRWGRARRRAIAAALVLAAPAVLVASAASADQEPRFARYVPVTPGTSCVPDDVAGVVNAIAWAEIERLGGLGLPACDATWSFVSDNPEWAWTGYARPALELGAKPVVWIVQDVEAWAAGSETAVDGEQLEQDVRSTVRHELGHVLTYILELDDAELRGLFPAELEHSTPRTALGYEASAEAITAALTPADETRTVFYDEDVPEENLDAAELVLGAFVTD